MENGIHLDGRGPRAVVYTRSAGGDRDQLVRQERACLRYAEAGSWQVVGLYRDEGSPGLGLAAAIEDAGEHRATVLVVTSLYRLGRDAVDVCRAVAALSVAGMAVIEATGATESNTVEPRHGLLTLVGGGVDANECHRLRRPRSCRRTGR
jgi:DNA invertase Pin-like site-specific DNA recombinase